MGDNENAPSQYATWERNLKNDGDCTPNFYFGHYMNDRDKAYKDFENRVKDKIADNISIKEQLKSYKDLSEKLKSDISKNREVER